MNYSSKVPKQASFAVDTFRMLKQLPFLPFHGLQPYCHTKKLFTYSWIASWSNTFYMTNHPFPTDYKCYINNTFPLTYTSVSRLLCSTYLQYLLKNLLGNVPPFLSLEPPSNIYFSKSSDILKIFKHTRIGILHSSSVFMSIYSSSLSPLQ